MKKLLAAIWLIIVVLAGTVRAQEANGSSTYSFVGTKNCKKCHIKQFKTWQTTNMAKAFDNLKPGERPEAKKKVGLDPGKAVECHKIIPEGVGRSAG